MLNLRFITLALALMFGATAASAETLAVRVSDCAQAPAGSLDGLVKLEIDVLLRERGAMRTAPDEVAIRCQGERASIVVALDGVSRDLVLELATLAPEHRARAIALAAAELVYSMSTRDPPAATPAPVDKAPLASSRVTDEPESSDSTNAPASLRPSLGAGVLAEWLGTPKAVLFGARVGLRYPLGKVVAPALSLNASVGNAAGGSARVHVETLAAAACVYFGAGSGLRWEAGPGFRLAWVRLSGQPEPDTLLEGRSLSAAWGGPELGARVAYTRADSWLPGVALELGTGVVVLPVRGRLDGDATVFALDGYWVSASAQLGFAL